MHPITKIIIFLLLASQLVFLLPKSVYAYEADSQKTYIGEYSDDETDLSYLNARYYDPARGQFLSEDSVYLSLGSGTDKREQLAFLDPQSQNSYSYARGNPIGLKDESGEFIPLILGAAWMAFEVGSSVYDTYTTYNAWADPNGSSWDRWSTIGGLVVGAILPGGGYGSVAGKADDVARAFTKSHPRENLLKYTGKTAEEMRGYEAHHLLPQSYRVDFEKFDLNIDDPKYLRWWKGAEAGGTHQGYSKKYNDDWNQFIEQSQKNGTFTKENALQHAEEMNKKYSNHYDESK